MSKLGALNGSVFVLRDPKEHNVGGIDISGGAQVGSLYGTIASIGECSYANVGDLVHIPHYGVIDAEVNGQMYAIFKQDRLFFVNGECVNGYAMVRKCANDHIRDADGEIALYMTEKHIEWTNWVEVLEVADDCKTLCARYIGMYCVAPENDEKLARIGNTKDFCLHESLIHFLTED